MHQTGKIIILIGILTVVVGVVVYFAGDKFGWLGRLPGDIRIEKENLRIYFPLTTMILASLIISAILWVIRKFF